VHQPVPEDAPSALDVLDRVLTKGIVIFYDVDISVGGLRVIEIGGSMTVMSLETYTTRMGASPDGETTEAVVSAAEEYLRDLPGGDAPHFAQH
jgi:gas vesicle protein GvpA/GvpJ/GvpM family